MQETTKKTIKNKNSKKKRTQFDSFNNNRICKNKRITRNRKKSFKNVAFTNFYRTNNLKELTNLEYQFILKKGLFSENQTPEQVIKEIYPYIKNDVSIFLHTKNFTEETKPIEFLSWMINSFNEVCEDNWDILYEDEKYHLEIFYDYDCPDSGYSAELKFLETIEEKDLNCFGLLIDLFGLFHAKLSIPFYFNCSDHENALQCAKDDFEELKENGDEDDICGYQENIDCYTSGTYYVYGEYIKNSKTTLIQLKSKVKSFKPKTELEKSVFNLLEKGLNLLDYKCNFFDFIHTTSEELEDSYAVYPFQYMMFGWDYDEDCGNRVPWFLNQDIQSCWNEGGTLPFRQEIINNEDVKISQFPIDYMDVLNSVFEIEKIVRRL